MRSRAAPPVAEEASMFTELIRALADEAPRTMSELSAELGTDAGGLRRALDHCERMGYLERMDAGLTLDCGGSCGSGCGCGVESSVCDRPDGAAWWRVTDRGRRAARLTAVKPSVG
jgi:predicted ArsR family transcriptional regulator